MRKYLHLLILIVLIFKLSACGVSSGVTWDPKPQLIRIQEQELKNVGTVNYDTQLKFYCRWSNEANINLYPARCIPFNGYPMFSDNKCEDVVLGLADPKDINKPANYIYSWGKFYQLTYPIQPNPSLLLWAKDQQGTCRSYPNTSASTVFRVATELDPLVFAEEQ